MESWLTSSVEARELALISRQYGVHREFIYLLCRNLCSYRLETSVSGNLWSCLKEVKQIVVQIWNVGWVWSQCRQIGLHLELIWDTPSYFAFLP